MGGIITLAAVVLLFYASWLPAARILPREVQYAKTTECRDLEANVRALGD
jgi:hypothetical protein